MRLIDWGRGDSMFEMMGFVGLLLGETLSVSCSWMWVDVHVDVDVYMYVSSCHYLLVLIVML